jgi:enolase-phosphatase E1
LPAPSGGNSIRAILLDIEGTTTPVDFVYRTLFPYSRAHLQQFLLKHCDEPDVRSDIEALRAQHRSGAAERLWPPVWNSDTRDLDLSSATAYGHWLMDRDSKCTALKSLQGKIWHEGYELGELHGEVYPDVPPALERWSREGKLIAIFSSGSVLAQKLLFASTSGGDLTRYMCAHFDTAIGAKHSPQSYSQISLELDVEPPNILFVSDVAKELDAAWQAGMQTALCVRTERVDPIASSHRVINSFGTV